MDKKKEAVLDKTFNALDVVRRVCAAHDFLFLSRSLTYHIAASADMPQAMGRSTQIEAVLSELVEYMARNAPYGANIGIGLKEMTLRRVRGVEIVFKSENKSAHDLERTELLELLIQDRDFSPIAALKEAIDKHGGRMSVDVNDLKQAAFFVFLPMGGSKEETSGNHHIFKYDITIKNIANIRKGFGIKKSYFLVSQVEHFVRSLVRHPIDIVSSVPDQGVITTIYEAQKGGAQSVASRISARLGAEKFQIGKKEVALDLKYNLSPLSSTAIRPSSGRKQ